MTRREPHEAPPHAPRVMILNQYYQPDVASTGHLLHELATELAANGFRVSVLTSRPCYGPPETWQPCPLKETTHGVNIRRLVTTRLPKDRMLGRGLNTLTFMIPMALRVLFTSRRDTIYLYTTNPPFLGVIGALVSLFRKHHYVLLLHDAYPHLATWVGKIKKGGFIERVWHLANRITYRRAEQTIVLCQAAKMLVCDNYGVEPERVHTIPNWADGDELRPKPKRETEFAARHGLKDAFTLLYSGNLGLYYEFETLLDAAEKLKNDNFRLVLVGSGGRKPWLADQIAKRGLNNTLLLPYQPANTLRDSLNACDASLVTIAKGIEGISFPSKLYSSLAVGKPILAISERQSELRDLVESHGLGRWCELGDSDSLVRIIGELRSDPAACERMGQAARRLFESHYTKCVSCSHYAEVLRLAAPAPHAREALA